MKYVKETTPPTLNAPKEISMSNNTVFTFSLSAGDRNAVWLSNV